MIAWVPKRCWWIFGVWKNLKKLPLTERLAEKRAMIHSLRKMNFQSKNFCNAVLSIDQANSRIGISRVRSRCVSSAFSSLAKLLVELLEHTRSELSDGFSACSVRIVHTDSPRNLIGNLLRFSTWAGPGCCPFECVNLSRRFSAADSQSALDFENAKRILTGKCLQVASKVGFQTSHSEFSSKRHALQASWPNPTHWQVLRFRAFWRPRNSLKTRPGRIANKLMSRFFLEILKVFQN